jgi:hypothetical protein
VPITPLIGGNSFSAPAAKVAAPKAAPAASAGQLALQQLLGLANNDGVMTGGSAGYTVSNAPARAAEQAAYNQAEANRQQVYSQAVNDVLARAPEITQSYDNAASSIQGNAAQRATSDAAAADTRSSNAALAAQRLGLNFVPTTQGLANQNQDAQAAKYKTNADAWSGLLAAQKGTTLNGNQRTANAFTYSGMQAQAALAGLLQQSLARLQDVYHGGSSGRLTGGTSAAQKASIYKTILGFQGSEDSRSLSAKKAAAALKPKTSTTTKYDAKGKVIGTTKTTK